MANHRITLTWVDWYVQRLSLPAGLTAILSGLALYSLGLGLSIVLRFADIYARSTPVYLGAIGFALATGAIRWLTSRFPHMLLEIGPCFATDARSYHQFARQWMAALSGGRAFQSFAIVFLALCILLEYAVFDIPRLLADFGVPSLRPPLFPHEWFTRDPMAGFLVMTVFAVACGLALCTGIWLAVVSFLFLLRLRRFRVIPVPAAIVARFRSITGASLAVAFVWAIGILLFVELLVKDANVLTYAVLAILSGLGILTFFLPQWVVHGLLVRSHDSIAEGARLIYARDFMGYTGVEVARAHLAGESPMTYWEFVSLSADATQGRVWVYDFTDAAILVAVQVLPIAAVALRSVL